MRLSLTQTRQSLARLSQGKSPTRSFNCDWLNLTHLRQTLTRLRQTLPQMGQSLARLKVHAAAGSASSKPMTKTLNPVV